VRRGAPVLHLTACATSLFPCQLSVAKAPARPCAVAAAWKLQTGPAPQQPPYGWSCGSDVQRISLWGGDNSALGDAGTCLHLA